MRYIALLFSLYMMTSLPVTARLVPTCYPRNGCEVDPIKMKEAIDLIPNGDSIPSHWFLAPNAYRSPALFQVSDQAQILVQVLSAHGLAVNATTLMTLVWPNARYYATQMFDECEMSTYGSSGRIEPVIRRKSGPQYQQLEFRLDMTCEIEDGEMSWGREGVITTYTPLGIKRRAAS